MAIPLDDVRTSDQELSDATAAYLTATWDEITATEHLERISALTAAASIRAMDFSTVLPVLMMLLADPARDCADVAQTAVWLESFLARRMVCSLNPGMYGPFLSTS